MKLVFLFSSATLCWGNFHIFDIRWGLWSALRFGHFAFGEKNPGSHCIQGLKSLRAGANALINKLLDLLFWLSTHLASCFTSPFINQQLMYTFFFVGESFFNSVALRCLSTPFPGSCWLFFATHLLMSFWCVAKDSHELQENGVHKRRNASELKSD